jgi:hypothetical protein
MDPRVRSKTRATLSILRTGEGARVPANRESKYLFWGLAGLKNYFNKNLAEEIPSAVISIFWVEVPSDSCHMVSV